MAEQDEQREPEDKPVQWASMKVLWHASIPAWLPICLTILAGFTGAIWQISAYKTGLDTKLSDLKSGQGIQDSRLAVIEEQHHMMVTKIDKVMFRLHIPLYDPLPENYVWPSDNGKTPDASLDKELDHLYKKNGHSRIQPLEPVVGSMKVPPPPQDAGVRQ